MTEGSCKTGDCDRPAHTRGWCARCYKREREAADKSGDESFFTFRRNEPVEARYWRAVVVNTEGCWGWTSWFDRDGYGRIRNIRAPRLSWQIHHGPIPDGMCVLHRCDNPPCTRPDHLFLGTIADNNADKAAKGRSTRGRSLRGNHVRGEAHHAARITNEDVRAIRELYAAGMLQREIGERFGVRPGYISNIITGRSWGHVT